MQPLPLRLLSKKLKAAAAQVTCLCGGICYLGGTESDSENLSVGGFGVCAASSVLFIVYGAFWGICEIAESSVEDAFGTTALVLGLLFLSVLVFIVYMMHKEGEKLTGSVDACVCTSFGVIFLLLFVLPTLILGGLALFPDEPFLSDCTAVHHHAPLVSSCQFELDDQCDVPGLCPEGTDIQDCHHLTDIRACEDEPKFIDRNGFRCEDLSRLYLFEGQVVDSESEDLPAGFCTSSSNNQQCSSVQATKYACRDAEMVEDNDEEEMALADVYQAGWTDLDKRGILEACPKTCDLDRCDTGRSFFLWVIMIAGPLAGLFLVVVLGMLAVQKLLPTCQQSLKDAIDSAVASALADNEHTQAGARAWNTRADAAHLDKDEMKSELSRIRSLVTKEYGLAFHFVK